MSPANQQGPLRIPEDLRECFGGTATRRKWLDSLPSLLGTLVDRWQLSLDIPGSGSVWSGNTALVVPVRADDGAPYAVKIAFPYPETLLEPLALALWDGQGAVRLIDVDHGSCAMLLERLDGNTSLVEATVPKAIETWGSVMRELMIAPDTRASWGQLPRIDATLEQWSDTLPETWEQLGQPFPRWLLETALEVCQTRGAVGRRSSNDVLVHTDLHFLNILATFDGGYRAIDPQPQLGEAEFAVAPMLWNRLDQLDPRDPARALKQRNESLCAAAGLDAEVARQYSILREVENALDYLTGGAAADAERSLWVASTLAGATLPGLPPVGELHSVGGRGT